MLALKWYTAAADSGYVRSMSMLAKSYENGIFIAEVAAWCGGALYMVLKYYRSVHKVLLVS